MKRVLFISYYFPPTGGAPAQRSLKFARYLPDEGYCPIVVTQAATSHNKWSPGDPSLNKEVPPVVRVYRVETEIPLPRKKLRRLADRWLSRPSAFSRWWVRSAVELGEQVLEREKAELIYASMSPFESAEVATQLSRKHQVPWVADLRDPWVLDEIQVYPSFFHRKIALNRMHRLLSTASTVVMNTPEAAACLKSSFPGLKRIRSITNGFDSEDLGASELPERSGKFTIVHAGLFLIDSGLPTGWRRRFYEMLGGAVPGVDVAARSHEVLFKAIHRWCQLNPSVRENLEVVFVGEAPRPSGRSPEEQAVFSLSRSTGYVPRNESLNIVRTADLLFLPMHNMPEGKRARSAPSKIYEYMASGRPILAAVPEGDARDYLAQTGTALICRPNDFEGMIRLLDESYQAWNAKKPMPRVNQAFVRSFERRELAKQLAREFDYALAARENSRDRRYDVPPPDRSREHAAVL